MPDWDEILTRDGPAVWRTAYRIVRLCRRTRSSGADAPAATDGRFARDLAGNQSPPGPQFGTPEGPVMTTTRSGPEPDDRLARAEALLRDAPVPDGPTPDVIDRTRAALHAAANRPTFISFRWRRTMLTLLKLTAAAMAAAAGLSYLAYVPRAAATATFAEVAQKLHDAHTLSYRLTLQMPGQKAPNTGREFYKDPGLVRSEMDAPQVVVTIVDTNQGKILTLDPSSKIAMLQE